MNEIKNSLRVLMKLPVFVITIFLMIMLFITKTYAASGEDYNSSKATLCATHYPYYSKFDASKEQLRYIYYPAWGSDSVSFSLTTNIYEGGTSYCSTMKHSHPHYYKGYVKLWVNADASNETCLQTEDYYLTVEGEAYTQGDSSNYTLYYGDLSQYIDMDVVRSPSIYSEGFSGGSVYATAIGGRKQGTAHLEVCTYVIDWSGPGDNVVNNYLTESHRIPDNDRYHDITVTDTDPIDHYYYTFNNNSRSYTVSSSSGNYGSGASFSSSVNTAYAGKYCHVTFYTESGEDVSTVIAIPDLVTLSYSANGGSNAPTAQMNNLRLNEPPVR